MKTGRNLSRGSKPPFNSIYAVLALVFYAFFYTSLESHTGFPFKFKFGAYHKKARFLTIPNIYDFLCPCRKSFPCYKRSKVPLRINLKVICFLSNSYGPFLGGLGYK